MSALRIVNVRRARLSDSQPVFDVVNAASPGTYKDVREVKSDIQLSRFEEQLCGFCVACCRATDLPESSTSQHGDQMKKNSTASSIESTQNEKDTNSGDGKTDGKTGEEGGGIMKNLLDKVHGKLTGKEMLKSDIAKTELANKSSCQSSQTGTPGGSSTPLSKKDIVIGCIRVGMHKFASEKMVNFFMLTVHPDYQGLGVGRLLLKVSYEWAMKRGVKKILIEVKSNRTDLFIVRPTTKDSYLGITDPRSSSQMQSDGLYSALFGNGTRKNSVSLPDISKDGQSGKGITSMNSTSMNSTSSTSTNSTSTNSTSTNSTSISTSTSTSTPSSLKATTVTIGKDEASNNEDKDHGTKNTSNGSTNNKDKDGMMNKKERDAGSPRVSANSPSSSAMSKDDKISEKKISEKNVKGSKDSLIHQKSLELIHNSIISSIQTDTFHIGNKSLAKKVIDGLRIYPSHKKDLMELFIGSENTKNRSSLPHRTLLESLWPDKKSPLKGIPAYVDDIEQLEEKFGKNTDGKNGKDGKNKDQDGKDKSPIGGRKLKSSKDSMHKDMNKDKIIYSITERDIITESILHPDFKRPIPGGGYFGKLGFVQIGSTLGDPSLTNELQYNKDNQHLLLMKILV